MTYRFTSRSTNPGDYRWINYFFAGIATTGDVRDTIDRGDGITGVLDVPSTTNVLDGVVFDNSTQTGVIIFPSEDDVRDGVNFGIPS